MRRPSLTLLMVTAAGVFSATLTASLRAHGPDADSPPAPAAMRQAPEAGNFTGPGSCSAIACHGAIRAVPGSRILQTEYSAWISQDHHAQATEVLSNPVAARMGKILGIGRPDQAQKCLACHSLDTSTGQQARNYLSDGVSCEACHGAATGWLGYHVTKDAKHEESVRRGMYDTKDLVKRAEKCLTCHLGTADKAVDHEMIAAGHPDLVFDLEAYSAAMPRHWREAADADPFKPVRNFAVGQLVQLRGGLDRLGRRVKGPTWPEYAELDCFGCHHALARPEDSWRQAQGYEHRARPGNPSLNVSRYVTARHVLETVDAGSMSNLDGVLAKLQIEASRLRVNDDEVVALSNQARAIVDRGVARASTLTPAADTASRLLSAILADVPSIAERGERAAEQAAMAAETLATALARARGQDPGLLSGIFAEVFRQFESPSSYDPRKFTASMARVQSLLPHP